MPTIIRAKFMIPLSNSLGRTKRISDGYVLYQKERILEAGAFSPEIGNALLQKYNNVLQVVGNSKKTVSKVEDIVCLPGLLLPGFIKSHGHDYESPIIGIVKDAPLTEWLDGAVNVFGSFMEENRTQLTTLFGYPPTTIAYLKARVDDIYYGITSSMVHHCGYSKYHVRELVDANERAGTRMHIAIGSQDRNYFHKVLDSPQQALERLQQNVAEHESKKRTRILPGPDQFFSNGPEMLKQLKGWADKNGSLIHIHSAEEHKTTMWFREKYGMSEVEYGKSVGFLGENTVLAHQVHCTKKDLDILRETGTKIVHNPLANTILGSGMPPVVEMLEKGIDVVISTDGSGSADSQNILSAARLASQYQKAHLHNASVMPAQKVLEMITVEPAKMLGINAGSLETGKDADIILIDLRRPNMTPSRVSNVLENLIWSSDGSEVQYVIAGGKIVKDNYQFTTLDTTKICDDVQKLSELLDEYRKKPLNLKGTGAHQ